MIEPAETETVEEAEPAEAEVVEIKPATKKKKAKKKGAKQVLREKLERNGEVTQADIKKIVSTGVTRSTVTTALTDLKNAKYAGAAGPLNIVKGEDDTYRLVE